MHVKLRALLFTLILLAAVYPLMLSRPAVGAEPYRWQNVAVGGGGYVLDVYCHPKQKDLVYLRTDVGGFYRWDAPQSRWIPITDGFARGQSSNYGGEGLALDPQDPKLVYIAAGKYEWAAPGTIYKSSDQGQTWKKLPLDLKMGGNEDHRAGGPRLVVSPFHSPVLLFGSRQDGVWRSADAGESWSKVTSFGGTPKKGIGINAIAFSAKTPGVVFLSAFGDGVYQSDDDGRTWRKTPGGPAEVERLASGTDGALYATHAHGVGKYAAGRWTDITPPGANMAFNGLAADPKDAGDLLAAAAADHLHLFRSRDGGATWAEKKTVTQSTVPWYSPSMKQIQYVAGLTFDPNTPGRVWLSDWYAAYRTDNIDAGTVTLTTQEQGHEELVVFTLAAPPSGPPLLSGTADVDGFVHDALDTFPAHGLGAWYGGTGPTFGYTEGFAWCASQPDHLARAGVNPWNHTGGIALSNDAGRTWAGAPAWDAKILAARVALSPTDPDNMVALRVGAGAAQATTDGGKSWRDVAGLPDNLIPDVWNWQSPLAADSKTAGVFYAYHDGRVYKSADGGATFAVSASGLPGGAQALTAIPGMAGDLWLNAGGSGLFHSTDGGRTFEALPGVKEAALFAPGKPRPGTDYPALYLLGTLADGQTGIFRSSDKGAVWEEISDPREPVGDDPNSMAASFQTYGLVFIGTNGRGIYYGQPQNGQPRLAGEVKTADAVGFPNGDMSRGDAIPEGWAKGWTGSGKIEVLRDTETFKSAPASLSVRTVGGPALGGAAHGIEASQPPFTLSGFIKSRGQLKSATVAIQAFDGGGKQVGWIQLAQVKNSADWQAFSGRVALPKEAANAQIVLLLDGDGQAWLDDLTVVPEKLAAPAPAAPPLAEAAPLPVALSPTDPLLRYEGRFDRTDPAGPRCAWSASQVTLKFKGSALNVKLSDSDSDEYQIVVDGNPAGVLVPRGGTHLYQVVQFPAAGVHTVALVKRTEAFFGTTQFQGFQVSQGGRLLPLPARSPRRIEVIGDSISCGYGNEAKDQTAHFSPVTENAYLSYGAVAARALGAEYVCAAWSGRTMWPKNTMGEVYDRILPQDPGSRWDFAQWVPEAVVINLSTNDFAGGTPDQKGWTAGYEAFLAHIRQNYPHAVIYCATSPMLWGAPIAIAKSYLTQIVQDENAAGDKNVHLLVFETQDSKNGFGADWHPSVKTHAIMADKLAATLETDLGWQPAARH